MSFLYSEYIFWAVIFFLILVVLLIRKEYQFTKWVELNWFLKRKKITWLSFCFYTLAIGLFILACFDLRGPTEYIKTEIPDQKTIILLDQSASMLAEDIRPSRYERAIMVARHFVRNAVGHRVSIIIFSDTHRRIVPFTSDIDFLDARLDALRAIDISSGGTNLSLAMNEVVNYFKTEGRRDSDSSSNLNISGNLIVFTDAEEHVDGIPVEIPSGISLAMVGVGTVRGARIPLRDRNNNFRGYKRFRGEEIVTKLDEDHLRALATRAERNRFWILRSGMMPTDEILDFFREGHLDNISEGSIRVRPVVAEYLIVPAIILIILSTLLNMRAGFYRRAKKSLPILLISLISFSAYIDSSYAYSVNREIERLRRGELNYSERLKLAEQLAKSGRVDEAEILFRENFDPARMDEDSIVNYGTTLLKQGKIADALELLGSIWENEDLDQEKRDVVRRNLLRAVEQQVTQDRQEQQERDDRDGDEQDLTEDESSEKDGQESSQESSDQEGEMDEAEDAQTDTDSDSGRGEQVEPSFDESGEWSDDPDREHGLEPDLENESSAESDDFDDEGDSEDDLGDDLEGEQDYSGETLEEREARLQQQRNEQRLPGVMEQILDQDRNFQDRFLNTNQTREQNDREWKDW